MLDRKERIALTIDALQPKMEEYADNSTFHYWMSYACELDELMLLGYQDDTSKLVERLNTTMTTRFESNPEHHACVDVASTLESSVEGFKGVFTYGA